MGLHDEIQAGLKQAMRDKDEVKRETLRMVIAGVNNRRIELGRALTDDDVLAVVQRAVKTRQDSAAQYRDAGRAELADREEAEIAVLSGWLPQLMDADATRAAAQAIVKELGLESKKDMGRLMKELMARHKGQVDGKVASQVAGELLS